MFMQVTPQDFILAVTEYLFRSRIPEGNQTGVIDHDDGILGGITYGTEFFLALPQGVFDLLAFGNIRKRTNQSAYLTASQVQRSFCGN